MQKMQYVGGSLLAVFVLLVCICSAPVHAQCETVGMDVCWTGIIRFSHCHCTWSQQTARAPSFTPSHLHAHLQITAPTVPLCRVSVVGVLLWECAWILPKTTVRCQVQQRLHRPKHDVPHRKGHARARPRTDTRVSACHTHDNTFALTFFYF